MELDSGSSKKLRSPEGSNRIGEHPQIFQPGKRRNDTVRRFGLRTWRHAHVGWLARLLCVQGSQFYGAQLPID